MESVLERVDTELSGLVDDIQRYQPIEERAERIIALDGEAMAALGTLKKHYDACRRLEALRLESQRLDKLIEETIVGLAECRKQLDIGPDPEPSRSISVNEVLNYATKITKFTHKQPGAETALPWPTEDAIRRGMIAQLVSTDTEPEQVDEEMPQVEEEVVAVSRQGPAPAPAKISLDLFDSDED